MTSNSSLYGSTPQTGNINSSNLTTLYSGNQSVVPNGNLVVPGTLTVNGCAILTNCSAFSLLPTNAESILFGGAATSISIGAGTGQTTIQNQLATANYTFPVADGVTGQVLVTDGAGTVSFAAVTTVGKTYNIDASTTTGGANLNLTSDIPTTDTVKFASGTGITVSRTDANTITITNSDPGSAGVTSITGTTNQINVSSPTGAVTLSTPQDIATTSTPTFAGARLGNVTVGVATDNTITTTTGGLALTAVAGSTVTLTGDQRTRVVRTTTNTNIITNALQIAADSTGTPAIGFGTAMTWQAETAPATFKDAGYIGVRSTDLTVGSEDFAMGFGLMQNGATYTEKAYLDSAGNFTADGSVAGTQFIAGGFAYFDAVGPFTTSTTASNQVASTASATLIRSLKYQYQITSGTAYQTVEIMIIHDGTTAYLNTYSDVRTGANLSTFDADISGGFIRLLVTPTNAVTTYKGIVTAVAV